MYLGVEKKSTIDFYVVCECVLTFVKSMKIDDGKEHILTNYKKGAKAVDSDHKPLVMNVMLEVTPVKRTKIKNIRLLGLKFTNKFSEITSKSEEFTDCVNNVLPVSKQANNWLRTLKAHCQKAFKTIIIRSRKIKPS